MYSMFFTLLPILFGLIFFFDGDSVVLIGLLFKEFNESEERKVSL